MNRRQFFMGWGALALSAAGAAREASRLGIGQVGTTGAHAAGKMATVRSSRSMWNVLGVVEPNGQRFDDPKIARVYDGIRRVDEEALYRMPELQVVLVETDIADATKTALRAIRAGKHVHLEKPGGFHHEEFKSMRREAERRGVVVQMGYMLRYNPAFELLYQAVREGWLGEITEVDIFIGKLGDAPTRSFIGGLPGGGMFELGCHVIDTVITLLGAPKRVVPFSTPSADDGVKDNQMAVFEYPRATAVVRCNYADPFGDPRRRISVTGTLGTCEIAPMESRNVTLSLRRPRGTFEAGTHRFQLEGSGGRFDGEFIDLYRVLKGEKRFDWSAQHDIDVHEAVLRASGVWGRP